MEEVRRSLQHKFAKGIAFSPATMCFYCFFFSAAHKLSLLFRLSICHQYRHTLYSGSHVLIMFCQHLGSVSLCCGHAVVSHYTDHPVIILFTHCRKEGRALEDAALSNMLCSYNMSSFLFFFLFWGGSMSLI